MKDIGFDDQSLKVWSDLAVEVENQREPVLGADAPQTFETRLKMWGRWHDAGLAANRDSDGGARRPYQRTEELMCANLDSIDYFSVFSIDLG